ncbi:hypothetical protein [Furfurilactobacillus curtus]|uniref:Uncharacterized protein n=1 Tax=Furfurilactobacillus curtus TaxID=1746200 RepID=A0ABQ5JNM5_9LACO
MTEDYSALLEGLRSGDRQELTVTPDQFMDFQQALMSYEFRQRIVGQASRGGTITYRYVTD